MVKMANKKRVNISVTPDTEERLKQYAFENHKSVSQAITDWIWSVKVTNENIRGQQTMEIVKQPKQRTAKKTESSPEQTKPKSRGRKAKAGQPPEEESGE